MKTTRTTFDLTDMAIDSSQDSSTLLARVTYFFPSTETLPSARRVCIPSLQMEVIMGETSCNFVQVAS